jgi:subtilisin-like proprotein convertase family protein
MLWLLLVPATATFAQMETNIAFDDLNLAIPDNDPNGVLSSQTLVGVPGTIASVQVTLDIAGTDYGAYNGDLYVELVNSSGGFAVLLNRVGVSSSDSFGYGDNGFDVTFDDAAVADVHFYQDFSYELNPGGQLTGTWQPDGENVSPLANPSTFDTVQQNQTATLSSFDGSNPNGTWTLFVSDVSPGGTAQLVDWSLDITTVPEPGETTLLTLGLVASGGVLRRVKAGTRRR